MCMPSLHRVLEPSVGYHPFVVSVPTLFNHGVQYCFNQCEPICIGLAKFKVTQLIFSGKGGFIKKGLAHARTISDVLVLYVLIHLNVVECNCSLHGQWDEDAVQGHLDET